MFISAPQRHACVGTPHSSEALQSNEKAPTSISKDAVFLDGIIEELLDGILVLTDQRELIHANECARRILRLLNRGKPQFNLVPEEIWHVCQTLIESRTLFPSQHWLLESKIFIDSAATFTVRARWAKLPNFEAPCLLIIIKDQYQSIKAIATEEAVKYGLTDREAETWLLHRANYTYKQISAELHITPNTVKKHMKSIHVKQKQYLGIEE
ncbi:MAG: helix-turn-helix transcriptional regulator [Elainellaceae cyanobacterium]